MERCFTSEPPELLDPETWETPGRLSLEEVREQTGSTRDRNLRFVADEAGEDDR